MCHSLCVTHAFASFISTVMFSALHLSAVLIITSLTVFLIVIFALFLLPSPSLLLFLHILLLLSCWSSSTCSIMCALCASVRFRATRFMSEVVTPIVRDTLTWWGDEGSVWCWLLPRLSHPSPSLHTRMTLINKFACRCPENNILTSHRPDYPYR